MIKKIKKLYSVACSKFRKLEKPKISYLLVKTLVLSIICSKCKNEDEKLFKKEESIEILKIIGLIQKYNYFQNIADENVSQEFRLKNIDETWHYLIEEVNRNELMSKKHKKVGTTLIYWRHFLF